MSSESLHSPRERLSNETLNLHFAIASLREELDAVDWYRQRADDTEDETLKMVLLHNMREEIEHAAMLIEWIRRSDADFADCLKTYLFSEGPILKEERTSQTTSAQRYPAPGANDTEPGFTIGSLRGG
ncbi:MAG TPA: ferritin [Stellaceae bacterium]|jgi:ferritin-like protein|nr:ferritin [Stellaceae bacterium]